MALHKDVQNLRERTGCGMMDCKKALTEAGGDMEKAIELLREKGLAAQAKNPAVLQPRVSYIPMLMKQKRSVS